VSELHVIIARSSSFCFIIQYCGSGKCQRKCSAYTAALLQSTDVTDERTDEMLATAGFYRC
jgi:hypothetical protein